MSDFAELGVSTQWIGGKTLMYKAASCWMCMQYIETLLESGLGGASCMSMTGGDSLLCSEHVLSL